MRLFETRSTAGDHAMQDRHQTFPRFAVKQFRNQSLLLQVTRPAWANLTPTVVQPWREQGGRCVLGFAVLMEPYSFFQKCPAASFLFNRSEPSIQYRLLDH